MTVTEVLLYALGILIVVIGLAVSIGLHEIGHLIPAKLFGVKVTQYMIGFGKTLWSRKRGETEYGVKMLPLGGYVAMTGMFPPENPDEQPREATTGFLNTVMQEGSAVSHHAGAAVGTTGTATATEADDADELAAHADDDARSFYRLAMWKKIVIMLGGPVMNLVLAFVFFGVYLVGFGLPQYTNMLGGVNECLISAESPSAKTGVCGPEDPAAPAAAAGLLPGDRVLAAGGVAVSDWEEFRNIVSASPGKALEVSYERDGVQHTTTLTPLAWERTVIDPNGDPVTGDDGKPVTEMVGMIGALAGTEIVPQSITTVPAFVGENVQAVAGIIIGLPQRMVDVWNAAFGSDERDPNGPMSVVGVGRLAGEVVSLDQAPVAAKAQTMFGLLGSLNVALFVFNLIPLMPLDGGHVAGALYEGAKRGLARLFRKPDPGPIDTTKMVPVTFVIVIALGAMSLLLIYADIVKPVSFFG